MEDDLCGKKRKGGEGSYAESRHWENKGVGKRKHVRPIADFCRYQSIRPDNTDYNSSKWVYFTIRTGNEFIRMVPNCLTFFLSMKIDPKDTPTNTHVPADPFGLDATAGTSSSRVIKGLKRCAYFNPLAGGPSTLISEIEIILDGQRVQINTGGYFSATNTLNKLFCPSAVRKAALSHNHVLNSDLDTKSFYNWYMHNQFQELEMKAYLKNPSFEYALMEVNAKGKNDSDIRICPVSGDIDGMLFLSRPKNLGLNSILSCDEGLNQHPILPPNTELQIRIRLNDPLQFRLIDTRIDDSTFFSATNTVPQTDKFNKGDWIDLHISDITLDIEKVRPMKEKLQKNMAQGSIDFTFDQYLFRARALDAQASTTVSEFDLPPNIGLVYIFFARSNQLIFDTSGNRSSDMTRFSFPKALRHIEFKLNGNRILFANGLEISRINAGSQQGAQLFYKYLVHRKLTDESFDTFFPKLRDYDDGNIGYRNCFPIDLTPYGKETPTKIEVVCSYDTASPNDFYCILFMPQSVTIHKPSRDSIWQTSATVG